MSSAALFLKFLPRMQSVISLLFYLGAHQFKGIIDLNSTILRVLYFDSFLATLITKDDEVRLCGGKQKFNSQNMNSQ